VTVREALTNRACSRERCSKTTRGRAQNRTKSCGRRGTPKGLI
jgi:hypothetical protein